LKFLIKRLPQKISGKLVLIFSSNRLDWKDNIDPRIKSFLKINELLFEPYNAYALNKILSIRIKKAINLDMISELDMYGFIQVTLRSRGGNGRTKEIMVNMPKKLQEKIKQIVLMEFDMNPI